MIISQLINTAYRKIGVVGHGQELTAEQAAAGLEAFNLMIFALSLDGIDFDLTPQSTPLATRVGYAATNDVPFPPAFWEGAIFILANRLAPEYSSQGFNEESFKDKMRAALFKIVDADMPLGLRNGSVYPNRFFNV